jgi:excisionase family DNA binding protein
MKHNVQSDTAAKVYLSPADASEILSCSRRNIEHLMSSGQLPFSKIGRLTRIDRDDLDKLVANNRIDRGLAPEHLCRG